MINQIKIITDRDCFRNDIGDEIRAFFFGMKEYKGEGEYYTFEAILDDKTDIVKVDIRTDLNNSIVEKSYEFQKEFDGNSLEYKSFLKYCIKASCYKILKKICNKALPYGSLTGIRPTKLYRKYDDRGFDADSIFAEKYSVSKEKIKLIGDIVKLQKPFVNNREDNVDIYVNIPFCPSRCVYCSFVTSDITKQRKYVKNYIKCLKDEIIITKKLILENNYRVRAIYVGGGTPSSLEVADLKSIIELLDFDADEFTVEAGRPDTITESLLEMLSLHGVDRISVNPQSFNQKTLDCLGRKHTVEQIFTSYKLAREFDFVINMDLIASLPNETCEDFLYSVKQAIALEPDNITVHALALKKGSELTVSNYENTQDKLAAKMISSSAELLKQAGYLPYYMYRQKNTAGNLENTGYTKNGGSCCLYNIDIMEENTSIIANGAGAISKRLFKDEDRLERLANMKNAKEYIERFDEHIQKQRSFWS